MMNELWWEREESESRVDAVADEVEDFVEAVLAGIDLRAAQDSPPQWELVCQFFAGCANAAKDQGQTAGGGGERVASYLAARFPCPARSYGGPWSAGIFEFMDWLADPDAFRPSRLRGLLTQR